MVSDFDSVGIVRNWVDFDRKNCLGWWLWLVVVLIVRINGFLVYWILFKNVGCGVDMMYFLGLVCVDVCLMLIFNECSYLFSLVCNCWSSVVLLVCCGLLISMIWVYFVILCNCLSMCCLISLWLVLLCIIMLKYFCFVVYLILICWIVCFVLLIIGFCFVERCILICWLLLGLWL